MNGYDLLPQHMCDEMQRYIDHGIMPGSFLTAVLSNDLMGALGRADEINIHALPNYGRFLYNHAPCGCFGSAELVRAWAGKGGLNAQSGAMA